MTSVDKAEKRNVIFEYLNEFCSAGQEVDFAVLLKGKWGAGKTHLIDGFLEQRKSRKDYDPLIKDLYISLNGMDNATQIDHACFKALHPILGSKAAKITVEAFKAAFRTLKFDIDNVGSIGVPVPDVGLDSENFKKKIGIIVFDDLERCQMPIQASLGYINYFIEQLHLKVIVIANEEEIQADSNRLNDYRRIKEKFIGRTVSVESDTDSALDNFISYIKDSGLRQILKEREAELIDMYNKSETYNLRILKQSLWDFERFYSALDSSHIANKLFFDAIFKIIIVFSFEMRAGRLIAEQLDAPIPSKLLRVMRGKDKEKCFIDKIEERYSVTDFDNFYVDHKTLKQFLFDGWVQAEKVRAEINQSAAFAPARELPSWKIAANLWHATDDQIESAAKNLVQEVDAHVFTELAEIFMVFSIILLLSQIGILKIKKSTILKDAKDYIDHLYAESKIKNKYGDSPFVDFFLGWGGYAFPEKAQEDLNDVYNYYKKKVDAVSAKELPLLAAKLLDLMQSDPTDYMRSICTNSFKSAPYWNVPILSVIPPKSFVDRILLVNSSDQTTVISAFKHRYECNILSRELADERKWLAKVSKEIKSRLKNVGSATKFRLERALAMYVEPFIETSKPSPSAK